MPDLTQSIASNQPTTDDQMPSTGLTFVAPASEELGGEINVAVLVNGIGQGSDDSPSLAIEAIRQSFLSTPTADAFQAIADAFKRANDAIQARQSGQTEQRLAGSSATIALLTADRLFVGNVGDNRVYLFREDETETLAADQSWVQEAVQSWHVKPGELQDRSGAAAPQQYLGKQERITPRFAPIEFLWPGDILLLCTAALVSRMRDNEIRDISTAGNPGEASRKLVQAAIDRGGNGSLTTLILQVPQGSNAYEAIPLPGRQGFRLSPVAVALVVANLFLVCLIAAVALRGSSFLSPLQPVEVAKPAFVATETVTPAPGLDVGVVESTPAAPSSTPTAVPSSAPAAAPTALPGNTPTPPGVPTFTPQPLPANWVAPPPPSLLLPTDGSVFSGPQAQVVLEWQSAGAMPEDIFYVVSIKKWVNGNYIGESQNWTKSNRIRLDSSFYTALEDGPRRFANAAPDLAGATDQFQWSVAIFRLTVIKPDGTLEGVPLSQPTLTRHFSWGPEVPTRVYGG